MRFFAWMHLTQSMFGLTIICASCVLCVYLGVYLPIRASHGEETVVKFVMDWAANFKMNVALSWAGTCASVAWAVKERRKRLKERKERDERIRELELKLDPNRTSSGLAVDGSQARGDTD